MTPERWRQVEELFQAVVEGRPDALQDADPELRREVESLLAAGDKARTLPPLGPWLPGTATPAQMTMLGPYRIEGRVGGGGMGDVYSATDTRLNRRVAIKRCSPEFAERFNREARAISALNHPNICTLYDLGPDYLVMELVEGDTLAARVNSGPLLLTDALRYASEIADALADAHAAGITHRDLKPANIMISRRGIKVLDFGLAGGTGAGVTGLTRPHTVLGTPSYMAPEQVRGEPVDARADLFSLGVTLFEMITGKLPFPGASLGRMLAEDGTIEVPRVSRLRPGIPLRLDRLVSRLLAPEPAARPATALAVRDELRAIAEAPQTRRRRLFVAAAAIVALGAAAGAFVMRGRSRADVFTVADVKPLGSMQGDKLYAGLSPDGSRVAFAWRGEKGDQPGIYAMTVAGDGLRQLTHTETSDVAPAWSPDGRQIAFQRLHPGQPNDVIVISSDGGAERVVRSLRAANNTQPNTTAWTPDGQDLLLAMADSETLRAGLFRVPVSGGAATRLVSTAGDVNSPAMSPDGRWLAFFEDYWLTVQSLGTDGQAQGPSLKVVTVPAPTSPVWSADSRQLLFLVGGLRVMSWDTRARTTQSLYVAERTIQAMTATWASSSGPRLVLSEPGGIVELRELPLADAGRRAAGPSKLLFSGATSGSYSHDGRWMAFARSAESTWDLWLADAEGEHARLVSKVGARVLRQLAISPDDRHIAFHARFGGLAQAYVVDIDPSAEMAKTTDRLGSLHPRQVVNLPYNVVNPQWSADGLYLFLNAYDRRRLLRVPAGGGEVEDLFESDSIRPDPAGRRIYYLKSGQTSMFSRSLEGDIRSNPEERVLTDIQTLGAFDVIDDGILYVGIDARGDPAAIRFFDFATKQSHDVAPLRQSAAFASSFSVSPDRRRMLYDTRPEGPGVLLSVQLQRQR